MALFTLKIDESCQFHIQIVVNVVLFSKLFQNIKLLSICSLARVGVGNDWRQGTSTERKRNHTYDHDYACNDPFSCICSWNISIPDCCNCGDGPVDTNRIHTANLIVIKAPWVDPVNCLISFFVNSKHDPKTSYGVNEEDREYSKDKKPLFGNAHSCVILYQWFHSFLLLQSLKNFEQSKKFDKTTDASNLCECKSLYQTITFVFWFQVCQEPWCNGKKVNPKPAFQVLNCDLTSTCDKFIGIWLIVACVEAYQNLNHEHYINNRLCRWPTVWEGEICFTILVFQVFKS